MIIVNIIFSLFASVCQVCHEFDLRLLTWYNYTGKICYNEENSKGISRKELK